MLPPTEQLTEGITPDENLSLDLENAALVLGGCELLTKAANRIRELIEISTEAEIDRQFEEIEQKFGKGTDEASLEIKNIASKYYQEFIISLRHNISLARENLKHRENNQNEELFRLLGYIREVSIAWVHPVWLCSSTTWTYALHAGFIVDSERKPFIPREGSEFIGSKLTATGADKFIQLVTLFAEK